MSGTTPVQGRTIKPNDRIIFQYENHRGDSGERRVVVVGFTWGSTQWHPEPGWLMTAADLDKDEFRFFAMKDMKDVRHVQA